MPSNCIARTRWRLTSHALWLCLATAAGAQTTPPPTEPLPEPASSNPTTAAANPAGTATDTPMAEPAADARPSLDYEPSETISEDKSVSFPVDI